MTMITPSYLGETIEYSSLHACRSTLEDPTSERCRWCFLMYRRERRRLGFRLELYLARYTRRRKKHPVQESSWISRCASCPSVAERLLCLAI